MWVELDFDILFLNNPSHCCPLCLRFFQLKFGMLYSFCPFQFVVHVYSFRQFEHQGSECLLYLLWRLGMYRVFPLVCLKAFYVFSRSSTTMTATTAAIAICTTWVLWSKFMKHSLFCALTLQFPGFTNHI